MWNQKKKSMNKHKKNWNRLRGTENKQVVVRSRVRGCGKRNWCFSVAKSCLNICDPMDCSTPACLVFHCLLEFAQTHVHWVSDTIQPSHPLSPPAPPALNISQHQGLFQWVSSLYQVAKVRSFSFSIIPSNEYSRLTSFRIDWLDLLAVKGTLKSLLQHHSSKASLLQHCPILTIIHDYWKNHSFD